MTLMVRFDIERQKLFSVTGGTLPERVAVRRPGSSFLDERRHRRLRRLQGGRQGQDARGLGAGPTATGRSTTLSTTPVVRRPSRTPTSLSPIPTTHDLTSLTHDERRTQGKCARTTEFLPVVRALRAHLVFNKATAGVLAVGPGRADSGNETASVGLAAALHVRSLDVADHGCFPSSNQLFHSVVIGNGRKSLSIPFARHASSRSSRADSRRGTALPPRTSATQRSASEGKDQCREPPCDGMRSWASSKTVRPIASYTSLLRDFSHRTAARPATKVATTM